MKAETRLKMRVMDDLKRLINCWFVKTQQVAVRGIPDILMCIRGLFIAMELKGTEKDKPDPLQKYNLEEIERCGGISMVVTPQNWAYTYSVLQTLEKGEPK